MKISKKNNITISQSESFLKETASRMGNRIRKIRTEKGLSQAELGEAMGLTADRIQKYENGARKPKFDMLEKFAYALGVEPIAFIDPVVTNHIGAMFAFFEMEEFYDLKIKKDGTKYSLQFGDGSTGTMNEYLKEWYKIYSQIQLELEVASSDEEKAEIIKFYNNWQWTFPQGIVNKTTKDIQKIRIKQKIEELQKLYDKLDSE